MYRGGRDGNAVFAAWIIEIEAIPRFLKNEGQRESY
jgi:hypothetical protein